MKKILQVLVLVLFPMISFGSFTQSSSSGDWISVSGNHFVNEAGETVVFKGVNIRDPHNLEEEGHWTLTHFQEAKNWGANVIRLPIHPAAWRARGEEAYLELIDQSVAWARELGIYLILDWHSIGNLKEEKYPHDMYLTTMEETEAFWNTVSSKYANEPLILMYELYNEPTVSGERFGECRWEDWKKINEDLIRIVRNNHPKSLIGVAGFNWAYDLTPVKENPIDAEGIVYISHPYPQKREAPWEPQWEADFGYVADTYPVMLTEIGFALAEEEGVHIPVTGDEKYGIALDTYAAKKGISWVVWCFDPDWSPYMFTDWDYTPTRQGAFYKKAMTGEGK